jgi:hypothetical protein
MLVAMILPGGDLSLKGLLVHGGEGDPQREFFNLA